MCHTTHELYDEMELWQWDEVQNNRWARALKASHRVGVRPIWYLEEVEQEDKRLSWATATRSLRRLKARITKVARGINPRSKNGNLKMLRNGNSYFRGKMYSPRQPELSERRDRTQSTV